MFVTKRNGKKEEVNFDKILYRIKSIAKGLDKSVDVTKVSKKTIEGLYDGVLTSQLDELSSQIAATMAVEHYDYSKLAARIAISNLHKNTNSSFLEVVERASKYYNEEAGMLTPLVADSLVELATKHNDAIENAIVHSRDIDSFDYFGIKTLERGYLIKEGKKIIERPQHMFMRVALGIHGDDIKAALETYDLTSKKYFTHATPTLFNAGTPKPQLSSCFLLTMKKDSISGIFETLKQCAKISKHAGGIGIAIHDIRGNGSYVAGTRGFSNGIIPMLRSFNETARYVDQGGKRAGSFAIYLEPWHSDIFDFLDLKKNHGAEEMRARDLFYGLWIPDLFMSRVEKNGEWSLFCPNEVKGLSDLYGEKFEEAYIKYEKAGKARKVVQARDLWFKIVEAQIETGTPYMMYKDAVNRKSNQKNLGTIRSSNLCTEIVEYTSPDEVAVCNLASISLPMFVTKDGDYDFKKLSDITKVITRNLNKVIDINFYPIEEAERSNLRHRPIGIGVQGLADTFALLKLNFDSDDARRLNTRIFETIYYAALTTSCELAEKDGPYETYKGSPISEGKFQFNMWGVVPDSGLWDWDALKQKILKHGVRNSLLVAPMPTASTAQILGNNESTEPFTSNLYVRRVLSGEFVVINKHLIRDLDEKGFWNTEMKEALIANNGSIQAIKGIPEEIKERYRTVWEIPQKSIIDMAADRGAYICQSQSMNIHIEDANVSKMTSMHFYAWKRGLKTGMYYLRNTPSRAAVQFTVKKRSLVAPEKEIEQKKESVKAVDEDGNVCISCGS